MTNRKGVIVLLEGSEQCGKTTLADKIHDEFKADYLHGDLPNSKDFFSFHANMCEAALAMATEGHVVVLDRCFISHEVYNTLFNGKPEYDTVRMFHRLLYLAYPRGVKVIVVYCRPQRGFDPALREEAYDDSDGKITAKFDEVINKFTWGGESEKARMTVPHNITYDWKEDPSGEIVLKEIRRLHGQQN